MILLFLIFLTLLTLLTLILLYELKYAIITKEYIGIIIYISYLILLLIFAWLGVLHEYNKL